MNLIKYSSATDKMFTFDKTTMTKPYQLCIQCHQKLNTKGFYPQLVYKTVSLKGILWVIRLKMKESAQKWLQGALDDPIAKILLKTSNLTKTQLETLLIDILAENLTEKSLSYDEKGRLRLTKAAVSRGSFNRTLAQAKKNVTESIYTILLLSYLGVIQSASLAPYQEVANKLQKYTDAYRTLAEGSEDISVQLRTMNLIREEIASALERLAKSKAVMDL